MAFNLVHCRNDVRLLEELLKVLDGNVRDTDGFDFLGMSLVDLLHRLPGVDPIVLTVRLAILRGTGPVHKPCRVSSKPTVPTLEQRVSRTKVEVWGVEILQRRLERRLGVPLVGVVQFSGQKNLFPGNAGVLDTNPDFLLVT